jgi:GNAT superfamily N-acetyltransferase
MAQSMPYVSASSLARAAVIRSAAIEDASSIRYLHATAFRHAADAHYSAGEIDAFREHVYAPAYTRAILEAHLKVACLGNDLVGTAGWLGDIARPGVAVIRYVFVRPPFNRAGIGRRLVMAVEAEARAAGLRRLAVDATCNAASFFARLGYVADGIAVRRVSDDLALPISRMAKDA